MDVVMFFLFVLRGFVPQWSKYPQISKISTYLTSQALQSCSPWNSVASVMDWVEPGFPCKSPPQKDCGAISGRIETWGLNWTERVCLTMPAAANHARSRIIIYSTFKFESYLPWSDKSRQYSFPPKFTRGFYIIYPHSCFGAVWKREAMKTQNVMGNTSNVGQNTPLGPGPWHPQEVSSVSR